MGTVRADLDWCQQILGDAALLGSDGVLWTRAELLTHYCDGYRRLLTTSQAVRRWTALDVPGRFTLTATNEWESRYAQGGSFQKLTWSARGGYECTSLWEVDALEGVTPQASSEGVTQEWERQWVNPGGVPFRFALPRDHERIVALYYDHRRLVPVAVRDLDGLWQDWRSLGGYPLTWVLGTGRTRTFEIYEIVTTDAQAYSTPRNFGMPRRFSGSRTYQAATARQFGVPRTLSSPDRQYLATTGTLGRPVAYHSSASNLLVLEVIGPELPDLLEDDTPRLVPSQLQKYLRYYTLARAWERQGEGRQPALAALCDQRFQRGVQVLRQLSWLTQQDHAMARQPVDAQGRGRPPRPRLPASYPAVGRW